VDECKALPAGLALMPNLRELWLNHNQVFGMGLHSSTFHLNPSHF